MKKKQIVHANQSNKRARLVRKKQNRDIEFASGTTVYEQALEASNFARGSTNTDLTRRKEISRLNRANRKLQLMKKRGKSQSSPSEVSNFGKPTCLCPFCNAIMWHQERSKHNTNKSRPTFGLCCKKAKSNCHH